MKVAMKYHSEHCIYLLVVLASVVMCGWGVRCRLHSSVGQEAVLHKHCSLCHVLPVEEAAMQHNVAVLVSVALE